MIVHKNVFPCYVMQSNSLSWALIATSTFLLGVAGQTMPAHAGPEIKPAIQSFTTTGSMLFNNGATFGYLFKVLDVSFKVEHLGVWDDSILGPEFPVGLFHSHETAIWDMDGNLLVSASIDDATATLKDQFWWAEAMTTLAPGSYIIGAYYPPFVGSGIGSEDFAADNVNNLITQPRIIYVENRRSEIGLPFSKPGITTPFIGKSWFGPNFSGYSVPGPLPFLGAGVAFGYSRKLRKRIKGAK